MRKDRAGERYNNLLVLELAGSRLIACNSEREYLWRCKCDCGNVQVYPSGYLTSKLIDNSYHCKACYGQIISERLKGTVYRNYKKSPDTETVVYKGIKFNRYPNSKKPSHQRYYRPHANHIKNGITALHREVWKDHYGEIPKGHHIHHKDGDLTNNDISNLECLSACDHMKEHKESARRRGLSAKHLRHLDTIRPLAAQWHRSPEGKKWHKEHAKNVSKNAWDNAPYKNYTCNLCGEEFKSRAKSGASKFCSHKCYSKNYYQSRVCYRVCQYCDAEFKAKDKKRKFCGRSCAKKSMHHVKVSD